MKLPASEGAISAYRAAVAEQALLRERLRIEPLRGEARLLAGADVSFAFRGDTLWAGLVVCDVLDGFRVVDSAVVRSEARFPYIPGLLGFREVPPLLEALGNLRVTPDAVLVDAQGTLHPRRFGSACHFGVLSGLPSVGCAKSLLCGTHLPIPSQKGSCEPVIHDGDIVGAALRTRKDVAPVFVSPGHLFDLNTSVGIVLRCAPRLRIPEPIRLAHDFVNQERRRSA